MKSSNRALRSTVVSIVCLFIFLFGLILLNFSDNKYNDKILNVTQNKIMMEQFFRAVQGAETSQRGFLLSQDKEYLKTFDSSIERANGILDSLSLLAKTNEIYKTNIRNTNKLLDRKIAEIKMTVNYAKNNQIEKAVYLFNSDEGRKIMDSLRIINRQMIEVENQSLSSLGIEKNKLYKIILSVFLLLFVTSIVSLITIYKQIKPMIDKLRIANQTLVSTLEEKNNEIILREQTRNHNQLLIQNLESKNKELNHFAYIASHDLQEPIRTVKNFISLFEEEYKDKLSGDAVEYFRFINNATSRMSNLIKGLLQYSRIGNSDSLIDADIQELIKEVIVSIQLFIEEKKGKVTIDPQFTDTLCVYKIEFSQLIQNLIVNGLKFNKENVNPEVHISFMDKSEEVTIVVKDNGIGISEQNFEKIFNIFSRLHSTSKYEGQGIGLAFCKKIVEQHKGQIWLESEVGVGTTFFVTIPKNLDKIIHSIII